METNAPTRLDALLRDAAAQLPMPESRYEVERLLMHVLKRDRAWLFAHATDPLPVDVQAAFGALLQRRIAGEPVAYLTGTRNFWTLELKVTPDTLIPRPETELLVELALERLPENTSIRVADLGTGSGAIALAIASGRREVRVIGTDVSTAALAIANENARANDIHNVEFRHGSWFAPLDGERFQIVVSNPPYIAESDPHLRQGDLRFEPAGALSSGADGLDAIREIVLEAPRYLLAGGWLLMEHGWEQGDAIRALLEQAGFAEVSTAQDLEGRDRVTMGSIAG
ncbi:peptide chain release factor N(5)-glutamine methyltransferase [Pseudoxanthomonas sp. UTMC 1351]|uniref:peptide chain release factor N(5)-glutamine methyltransferase n=1 Tax=Pseudoxanthomonas sp. UTMC 1351 TaxID=2695853 RepID=UPI0034CF2CB4